MENQQRLNNHLLVDFRKLLVGDSNEINLLQNEFETNGWCFIRLFDQKDPLVDKLDEIQQNLSIFFTQHQLEKSQYESSNAFGYSRVGHKEGIKVLIDQDGLANYHHRLTKNVEQTLQDLATLCNSLTNMLKFVIFKMSILAKSPTKDMVPLSPLGMVDIVHYFNERTGPVEQPNVGLNTDEVNCVPHFDPGLFSLSILSTCDGLQLNDRLQNKWIDGPNNSQPDQRYIGVIWLGEAASILTQNRFKSGIHRVVYPRISHTSRLTIWQEVCTVTQIETLLPQKEKHVAISDSTTNQMMPQPKSVTRHVRPDGMRQLEDERGISKNKSRPRIVQKSNGNANQPVIQQQSNSNFLPAGASITMTNQPNSVPLSIRSGGETMNHFMKRVENERGLSMSKSGIRHVQIEYPTQENTESKPKKNRSLFSKIFKS